MYLLLSLDDLTLTRCWEMLTRQFTKRLLVFTGVFIVGAKRTPFGTYGGVLKDHSATDLAEHAAKAALAAGGVAPELVNSVIMGNVMQVLQLAPTKRNILQN